MLRPTAIAGLLALAMLQGCGGGDPPSQPEGPPRALLERALAQPLESGEVEIDAEVALEGSSLLEEPARFSASGPFGLRGAAVPRFALEFDASVAGYGVDGELISDGEDGYVVFFGENYRLGTDHIDTADRRLAQAVAGGLDAEPSSWIEAPGYDGTEQVDGEHCHRLLGPLRVAALRADLAEISTLVGLDSADAIARRLESGVIRFLVADGDGSLCGFSVDARLAGPGELELDVRLSELGEPQEIERPEGGGFQAVEELLARFERVAGVTIDF